MVRLPNPEDAWGALPATRSFDRADVETRIGPTEERLIVLDGGLANLNVRVGAGQVLRVYRRDTRAIHVELSLLKRPWKTLRTPAVLADGDDYLVLEYVPHGSIEETAEHGTAVGEALAEIHAVQYEQAGFFGPSGAVEHVLPDFVSGLVEHVRSLGPDFDALGAGDVFEQVVALLEERGPEMRGLCTPTVLVHGDFKASNLHWTPTGELLVLDWEFAYAGPSLMDIGQLVRWHPAVGFIDSFTEAYRAGGGTLPDEWERWAAVFDLGNLAGLLEDAEPGSRRHADVVARIRATLDAWR